MKVWRVICLFSLGGLVEAATLPIPAESLYHAPITPTVWGLALVVSALGWGWSSLASLAKTMRRRLVESLTGQPQPLPAADPNALAAEVRALNAQIVQLRDTATSFDMAFDRNLECLDERLRQVEQRTAYVPPAVPPSVSVGRTV